MLHQRTLLGAGEPEIDPGATFERVHLDEQSWVDVARDWLRGADSLFDALVERVEWKQGKRWMYERMVDDPRLSALVPGVRARTASRPRRREARRSKRATTSPSAASGSNYYRDGSDSVAWHSDRELRELEDTRNRDPHVGGPPPVPDPAQVGGRSTPVARHPPPVRATSS